MDRIVEIEKVSFESEYEVTLRPLTFEEYIGQEKILKNVYRYRKGKLLGDLKGKNILLIDEGCQTGATALVCIHIF